MKGKNISLLMMVLLTLALMAVIVITQLFTNKFITALQQGNVAAVKTFRLNNGIQNVVNLSFDLQSKLTNTQLIVTENRKKTLTDSITMLGYNTGILTDALQKFGDKNLSKKITGLVNTQVTLSLHLLEVYNSNISQKTAILDSIKTLKIGDQIYTQCLQMQKMFDNNLGQTLITNSEQAGKLSTYNRFLALLAILAIVVMATIIIKRQAQQLQLIEELKAAEAAALKSRNAKDDFLANMSHELRTPLNALIGFANLLDETELNRHQSEYVDIIKSSSYNLLNIVNDVLDLSKIEAGKLTISHKSFNLVHFFNGVEKMFSTAIKSKNLNFLWKMEENVPHALLGDPDRLKQIFVNLVSNAIKFTHTGSIYINAGIIWVDNDAQYYKLGFTVKDTGSGIPNNKIESIFNRFEQLEQGSMREHGGTGLGLTIVKNLVERMGGSISVYSQVGEGTEFNFTCIFEKAGRQQKTSTPAKSIAPVYNFTNNKILAVEDNRANQILLKHILSKYNLVLEIANNGKEAIEHIKATDYDMILMDIQMPKMDGYSAINIVRNKLHKQIPIIAMTAYVTENEIKKCYEAGFNDYLPKPIDEASLTAIIAKHIVQPTATTIPNNYQQFAYLQEITGGDETAIKELLAAMLKQWELDKKDLTTAVAEKNMQQVLRIMHRVRSTFSPLGPQHALYHLISKQKMNNEPYTFEEYDSLIKEVDVLVASSIKIS